MNDGLVRVMVWSVMVHSSRYSLCPLLGSMLGAVEVKRLRIPLKLFVPRGWSIEKDLTESMNEDEPLDHPDARQTSYSSVHLLPSHY
jgi:hypothetical protein